MEYVCFSVDNIYPGFSWAMITAPDLATANLFLNTEVLAGRKISIGVQYNSTLNFVVSGAVLNRIGDGFNWPVPFATTWLLADWTGLTVIAFPSQAAARAALTLLAPSRRAGTFAFEPIPGATGPAWTSRIRFDMWRNPPPAPPPPPPPPGTDLGYLKPFYQS